MYHIVVKTGTIDNASTDSNVYISLQGTLKATPLFNLDNDANNFEKNNADQFVYPSNEDLGKIESITLSSDEKTTWYCDYVIVSKLSEKSQKEIASVSSTEYLAKEGFVFSEKNIPTLNCAFRNIRSLIPTTSGQSFRSIRSPSGDAAERDFLMSGMSAVVKFWDGAARVAACAP